MHIEELNNEINGVSEEVSVFPFFLFKRRDIRYPEPHKVEYM